MFTLNTLRKVPLKHAQKAGFYLNSGKELSNRSLSAIIVKVI